MDQQAALFLLLGYVFVSGASVGLLVGIAGTLRFVSWLKACDQPLR